MMPPLLANAGYAPRAAIPFMEHWGPRYSGGILRDRAKLSWQTRVRFISAELPKIDVVIQQQGGADWRRNFVRSFKPEGAPFSKKSVHYFRTREPRRIARLLSGAVGSAPMGIPLSLWKDDRSTLLVHQFTKHIVDTDTLQLVARSDLSNCDWVRLEFWQWLTAGKVMTSDRQLAANRRNAARSTGPRTAEGRAISSRNAQRHGILSERVAADIEDDNLYQSMLRQLIDEYGPRTETENLLVERLANLFWRERRLVEFESAEINQISNDIYAAQASNRMMPINNQILVGRYQTMLSNQISSTIMQLNLLLSRQTADGD